MQNIDSNMVMVQERKQYKGWWNWGKKTNTQAVKTILHSHQECFPFYIYSSTCSTISSELIMANSAQILSAYFPIIYRVNQ